MDHSTFTLVLCALLGILVGVLIALGLLRKRAQSQLGMLRDEHDREVQRISTTLHDKEVILSRAHEKVNLLTSDLATERERNVQWQHRFAEQQAELEQLNERMTKEFKLIANQLLDDKSKQLNEMQERSLKQVLDPFKERIKEFREQVQKVYHDEAKERTSLQKEVGLLIEQNHRLSQDAENLTKALKGDVKMQGNWGEVILSRLLERSGLTEGQEYTMQQSMVSDDGRRLQPDVVIQLPEDKHVIVDSKVSLVAYERFINSDDPKEAKPHSADHVRSVREHVKGLAEKRYEQLHQMQGLDFVLLFIPIEGAFAAVTQADGELVQEAYDRNVIIVSPSTLLATLRMIASMWKHERVRQNHQEIADRAGKLYDKFVGFTGNLIMMGQQMEKATKAYKQAMGQLSDGPGNLVKQTEILRTLGARTSKAINPALLDRAQQDEMTDTPELQSP